MPSHLHGLNIIQPAHSDSSSQDLLSGPFPDLSLWTHLPFETEESLNSMPNESGQSRAGEDDDELGKGIPGLGMEAAAIHDGHVNVVTGTTAGDNYPQTRPTVPPIMPNPSMNIASLLSSFAINPLLLAQQSQTVPQAASLAQLLAIYAASAQATPLPQSQHADSIPPPTKRQRKASVGELSPTSPTDASSSKTPPTVAEDKRRRNTAASARFRLKKKEREIAMENKAKELEHRVNELERECEGLRRENGWLKGLVVGVTGGATHNPSAGLKRPRDELSS